MKVRKVTSGNIRCIAAPQQTCFRPSRLNPVKRLALLLPVWLALAVGEPSVVHQCPMHGGSAMAMAEHGGHAGHSHHAPAQSGKQTHHTCSCISECANSAALVVAQTPTILWPNVLPAIRIAVASPLVPARRDAHTPLPFANGPPARIG